MYISRVQARCWNIRCVKRHRHHQQQRRRQQRRQQRGGSSVGGGGGSSSSNSSLTDKTFTSVCLMLCHMGYQCFTRSASLFRRLRVRLEFLFINVVFSWVFV